MSLCGCARVSTFKQDLGTQRAARKATIAKRLGIGRASMDRVLGAQVPSA